MAEGVHSPEHEPAPPPGEAIHLPEPSYLPVLTAFGIALALVGVVITWILTGIGAGVFFPTLTTLAMSDATPEDAGVASGLVQTTVEVGAALGLAVLASVAAMRADGLLAHGEAAAPALTSGYRLAFLIAVGLVVAAIGVAVFVLQPERRCAVESDAELLAVDPFCCEAA